MILAVLTEWTPAPREVEGKEAKKQERSRTEERPLLVRGQPSSWKLKATIPQSRPLLV